MEQELANLKDTLPRYSIREKKDTLGRYVIYNVNTDENIGHCKTIDGGVNKIRKIAEQDYINARIAINNRNKEQENG